MSPLKCNYSACWGGGFFWIHYFTTPPQFTSDYVDESSLIDNHLIELLFYKGKGWLAVVAGLSSLLCGTLITLLWKCFCCVNAFYESFTELNERPSASKILTSLKILLSFNPNNPFLICIRTALIFASTYHACLRNAHSKPLWTVFHYDHEHIHSQCSDHWMCLQNHCAVVPPQLFLLPGSKIN